MTHNKTIGQLAAAEGGGSHRPGGSWAVFFARGLACFIQWYRWTLSPALVFLFGANSGCRFTPTCSQYAREAIERHGALAGGALAVKRLCRCHPFGGCGHDPVPESREFILQGREQFTGGRSSGQVARCNGLVARSTHEEGKASHG